MGDADGHGFTFRRWQRYGKDRLYVKRAEDAFQLGFLDMISGDAVPVDEQLADELRMAICVWQDLRHGAEALAGSRSAVVEQLGTGSGSVSADGEPAAFVDLAENRPGASLQEQVDAAQAAGERATLLRRFVLGKHARSSWERGAIGERLVGAQLDDLLGKDPRWRVLHSVPVGSTGSDIDHVVIGPAGVFTLNAKNHKGTKVWVGGDTFMVNGVRQHHVRNSRHEAKRAARLLSRATGGEVTVRGMVVVVNAESLVVKAQPADVIVINRRLLVRFLRRMPERLASEQVEAIYTAARNAATWVA